MNARKNPKKNRSSYAVIRQLRSMGDPRRVAGMARYGINPNKTLGVPMPRLRELAKVVGIDHKLAQSLWKSGMHEVRILASLIADPATISEKQIDLWVRAFDSWDVCDQCCMNLFEKTPFAYKMCYEWHSSEVEFVKRAGFVMMARLAVSDKQAADSEFEKFLPMIIKEATDSRNYVKKAVNWALRQIGKRSADLNAAAIRAAEEIRKIDSKSARWIASDALRELRSSAVQNRLESKRGHNVRR